MARIEIDPNYTSPTFARATAATDIFKKEDVQGVAAALSTHDHSSGKGLPLTASAIPNGLITSAMIADGTIATADIGNLQVTGGKIAAQTIADGNMVPKTLTAATIADGTLTSLNIADLTIQSNDLADNAVTFGAMTGGFNNAATTSGTPVLIPTMTTASINVTYANRMVLIMGSLSVQYVVAASTCNLFLYRDSTSVGQVSVSGFTNTPAGTIAHVGFTYTDQSASVGSHTWSLYWSTSGSIALSAAAFSSIIAIDLRR